MNIFSSLLSFFKKKFWEIRTIRWRLEVKISNNVLMFRTVFVRGMIERFTILLNREWMS